MEENFFVIWATVDIGEGISPPLTPFNLVDTGADQFIDTAGNNFIDSD